MNSTLSILLTLTLSSFAFAGQLLQLDGNDGKVAGVTIAKTATASDGQALENVGAGLRQKKVGVDVKVYVAQLMVSEAGSFNRGTDAALDSVAQMQAAAMRMRFMRSVKQDAVMKAFKASLAANKIDTKAAHIKKFLQAVQSSPRMRKGKDAVVYVKKTSSGATVMFQDTKGKISTIEGPTSFMKELMSMWLGKTTDAHLKTLKNSIIKGN